jgi:hypothetical protein
MAHFAKIEDGNVTDIHVVNNAVITDENGDEQESLGVAFLKGLHGDDINWVQTSYNNNFKKQFAVIGGTYNSEKDIFINPKPLDAWGIVCESWTLDENDDWQPPTAKPTDACKDGGHWEWAEAVEEWVDTQVIAEDGFPIE